MSQWAYSALRLLPDPAARSLLFRGHNRAWPRLRAPRTFNEKVNWRILKDRRRELAWTCDKSRMKGRAAATADVRVPATVWSGSDVRELADVALPERWVLKPNNSSGRIHLGSGRPGSGALDDLATATAGWLAPWQSRFLGEWAYDQADPVYLVEEFIVAEVAEGVPVDYKFFVFDGVPQFLPVDVGRFGHHRRGFFTTDWRQLDVSNGHAPVESLDRPAALEEMTEVAARIAAGLDFLRVDLYAPDGVVWFGEVTPYPGSGLERIEPVSYDLAWGELWVLPTLRTGSPYRTRAARGRTSHRPRRALVSARELASDPATTARRPRRSPYCLASDTGVPSVRRVRAWSS